MAHIKRHKFKRANRRSSNARCPRCKKVRKMWLRANAWSNNRISSVNIPDEGKVCWICRIREIHPNWRPGRMITKI